MRILLLDSNHPLISAELKSHGFSLEEDFTSTYEEVCVKIKDYNGIILRSRIPIDENLLSKAKNLKFVARVGAGLENIDLHAAARYGVEVISSPEGNRDAVAEHVVGMLLILVHRLFIASNEVKNGIWKREENRGNELQGKTFGIIGYGNMGKATAKRLSGFGMKVIFHDIQSGLSDGYATQVSLQQLQQEADVLSLHIPLTPETEFLVDEKFIQKMEKNFYLINTARGKNVETGAVVNALKSGKILGAALDVLEYEKPSFEDLENKNPDLEFLLNSDKAIITPHIAGWTVQSKEKLARIIVDKITANYSKKRIK